MLKIAELQTRRLRMRQWLAGDRTPFAALNGDARVMEFFPAALSRRQSDALADRCQQLISERGWGFWAVEKNAGASFIGFVGLHVSEHRLPFSIAWR